MMVIRAPKLADIVWIAIGIGLFFALRTFFTPDVPAECPEGSSCYDAALPIDAGAFDQR